MSVRIAEYESDGGEEVTLPRSIAADNDIVFRRERLNYRLVLVAEVTISASIASQHSTRKLTS